MRAWIKPTMSEYRRIYTAYEWHMVDDSGRVVVYMQNRRDNPEPGAPPIDFPGMTVLQYAGDGMFSLEEDFWSLPEGIATAEALRGHVRSNSIPSIRPSARDWQRTGVDAGRADYGAGAPGRCERHA